MSQQAEGGPLVSINPATELFVAGTLQRLGLSLPYSEEFGGLNFAGSEEALVVNTFVESAGRYLVLERSPANDSNVGLHNNVAGYMQGTGDAGTEIVDTVAEELKSEAGIPWSAVASLAVGRVIEVERPNQRLYIVPALVSLRAACRIVLNHEHVSFGWYAWEDYVKLHRIPVVDRVYEEMIGRPQGLQNESH